MTEPPRWLYRLENYTRAVTRLEEGVTLLRQRPLSAMEREGLVGRFQFTWELAWKVLKDYLVATGIHLPMVTPAAVIKAGYAADIIEDGDDWLRALDARNRIAHTDDQQAFDRIIQDIDQCFFALLTVFLQRMTQLAASEEGWHERGDHR